MYIRNKPIERRAVLGALSATLIRPESVKGAAANSAVRIALLGCGNRGTFVTSAFLAATNSRVVGLADLFQDQLDKAQAHFNGLAAKKGQPGVDRNLVFRGPDAYKKLCEANGYDMIVLATPDYFHPEHLATVVDCGKHVYCEKPAAVDVAGCKRFLEIGKKAQGRLSLDVGFNVRYGPPFNEIVRRIHAGAIGKVTHASTFYHAPEINYPPRPNASPLEARIRNFYWDRVLSGDVIVDQNIHVIDLCNWVLKAVPVKAVGTGRRSVRKDAGNIWDHWSLIYSYPGDVQVSFNSVQFGEVFWDVGGRWFGDKGVAESYYSGRARVIGPEPWEWQRPPLADPKARDYSAAYAFAGTKGSEERKAKEFVESIVSGKFHNEAEAGAQAALSAILGRMAAYSGKEVSWEEMMASNQSYAGAVDLTVLE